jgi:hypothetical protein
MSRAKIFLQNPALLLMIAATAIGPLLISTQVVHAQYGVGGGGTTATPEQLAQCEQLGIERSNCNENTILAKERVTAASENPSTGSGTPMLSTETGQMAVFIGVLAAIFGGVAAVFFFKGRGSKPVTT